MGAAVGGILGGAVGVAISPVPIIAVILMLFSRSAVRNSLAFVAGRPVTARYAMWSRPGSSGRSDARNLCISINTDVSPDDDISKAQDQLPGRGASSSDGIAAEVKSRHEAVVIEYVRLRQRD